MKPFKFLWKHKGTRAWLIVSSVIFTLALVISLVITQNTFIRGTLDIVFGGSQAIPDENGEPLYKADYSSKDEVYAAAKDFSESVEEEGIVLLKNDSKTLPLAKGSKISVLGKNSVNMVYGGSGSSARATSSTVDLYDSLESAGFSVNPTLKSFYEDSGKSGSGRGTNPGMGDIIAGFATGETPASSYDSNVTDSFSGYADAAVVVISRIGGEGFDLPRTMKESYADGAASVSGAKADQHYLELDQNETDMLKMAYQHFEKVILVLNTPCEMELNFLDQTSDPLYSERMKAAMWIGFPGESGMEAVGKVLNGSVNPSGKTVDTYSRDFTKDPSYFNFGNNNANNGNRYTVGGKDANAYFVDYEEGIYVGYRYYETRGNSDGETWYKSNVQYPFGYGLSYTSFRWDVIGEEPNGGSSLKSDGTISIKVNVTNTGSVAGKDVVELYYTAPYVNSGIEKSFVNLGDFKKTKLLSPNESETVTLTMNVEDMRSYDYSDANQNGFKGYELEKGDYQLKISSDAHTVAETVTYKVDADIKYEKDETTNTVISNQFDDVSSHIAAADGYLTRNGWANFPTTPTASDREVTSEFISSLSYTNSDEGKQWYTDTMPKYGVNSNISFDKMANVAYDDASWDAFMDQLNLDEMANLIGTGAYGTIAIERLGVPLTRSPDGPSGFTNFMSITNPPVYNTCFYAAECVLGSTWNTDLAEKMGEMIGNEGLIGNERGDKLPYSGWYAPAVNIHRSPFSGRNWEYYSEDGFLSGAMAAQVVKGAKSKGVNTFVKHFALNDQETNRDTNGILVWANEQAMREIYLKPFEMAVKIGKTSAMMSSFNRIGTTWAGGDYALLTSVLREEWGFKGIVITDYALNRYLNQEQMIRTGGDLALSQGGKIPSYDNPTATQVASIKRASKNILYSIANSCAMNIKIKGYSLAPWIKTMAFIDGGLGLAIVVWGGTIIALTIKKSKKETKAE
jgi:beta-glucosidase